MTTYIGPRTRLPPGELVQFGARGTRADAPPERLPEVGPPEITAENIAAYLRSKTATWLHGNVSQIGRAHV